MFLGKILNLIGVFCHRSGFYLQSKDVIPSDLGFLSFSQAYLMRACNLAACFIPASVNL